MMVEEEEEEDNGSEDVQDVVEQGPSSGSGTSEVKAT
jgi:hypothetical protein